MDKIHQLQEEAKRLDMDIDWETASLVPKPLKAMTPHQRDRYVREWKQRQFYKGLDERKDNDPASPEQAWA